jgi:hypothetical protein
MEVTGLAPAAFARPAAGDLVRVRARRRAVERREGDDPPALAAPWARKPRFSVNRSRSCAELAVADHLPGRWLARRAGPCRPRRAAVAVVPRPGGPDAGGGGRAALRRGGLRPSATGGTLSGFSGVLTWRSRARPAFTRQGRAGVKPAQLRFAEVALRFHGQEELTIIEVAGPSSRRVPAREPGRPRTGAPGGRWLASPRRAARVSCGGPGRAAAGAGQRHRPRMSRKRARCSARWPPPSTRAGDDASRRRGRKRCRPLTAGVMPPADRRRHAACWPPGLAVRARLQVTSATPRREMAVRFVTDPGSGTCRNPVPQLPASRASAPAGRTLADGPAGQMSCRYRAVLITGIERGERGGPGLRTLSRDRKR